MHLPSIRRPATHEFKHPNHYKQLKEKNKDFLEEIQKEQEILNIGLKMSRSK